MLLDRFIAACSLVFFSLSVVSHAAGEDIKPAPAAKEDLEKGKKSIEKFLSLTSLWIIELEWTFGYDNRTPSQADRNRVMLAGDVSSCPADFREAWMQQVRRPGRNYIAPVLRKYGVNLADLRQRLQGELFRIDPTVKPPIPLYDEDEKPERYDPSTSGARAAILKAVESLRTKINGIDPKMAVQWKAAVRRVMLEFSLSYIETVTCMNAAGIRRSEVQALFHSIDTKGCPSDFVKAWQHDLPYFLNADFDNEALELAPLCKKYGVDEAGVLEFVKKKMGEWEIAMPNAAGQPAFRNEMKQLRSNLLEHR